MSHPVTTGLEPGRREVATIDAARYLRIDDSMMPLLGRRAYEDGLTIMLMLIGC